MAFVKIITSDDDKLSPEVTRHRSEAYENGYDDALEDVRDALEIAFQDSDCKLAPIDRVAGLKHALKLLEGLEESAS